MPPRTRPVQSWLILLVVASMLPLILFAAAAIVLDYGRERDSARLHMQYTSRALMQAVDRDLRSYETILRTIATHQALRDGDFHTFYGLLKQALSALPEGSAFFLADATGRLLLNTARPFDERPTERRDPTQVRKVFETGRTLVSDTFASATLGTTVIGIDVPVFQDGKVVYDFALDLPLASFTDILLQQRLPDRWAAGIVDRTGTLVTRIPHPERFSGRKASPALIERLVRGEAEGTITNPGLDGTVVSSTWTRSESSGWTVAVAQPETEFTAPLSRNLAAVLGGGLVLLLIGIGAATTIARRVSRSLAVMRDNAAALGRGQEPAVPRAEVEEVEEIGRALVEASRLMRARTAEIETIMETVPAVVYIVHGRDAAYMTYSRHGHELLRMAPGRNPSKGAPFGIAPTHYSVHKNGVEVPPRDLPLHRAARGEEVHNDEVQIAFEDGTSIDLVIHAVPVRDPRGEPIGAVGVGIDITERKRVEERQKLIMAELDHRVRNTLASIRSILTLAEKSALSKGEFADGARGRIDAMARAHGLLTQTQWRGASLRKLVFEELQPFIAGDPARLEIADNDVLLQPKAAVAVALVVHELATNAAKHGALSTPAGHVAIDWRIEGSGADRRLGLSWTESGGPRVGALTRRGFGTMLIETSLTHEFDAEAHLEFSPEGVRCVVSMPLRLIAAADREAVGEADAAPAFIAPGEAGLAGARVLVVEDDALIGLDIKDGLEDAGATVVGPVGRLDQAFALAENSALDAAVLDVNLAGEHVFPLADALAERGVPLLFLSGYDKRTVFPERYLAAAALQKPVSRAAISAMVRRIMPRTAKVLT